jgi:uncharacterized membrane protein/nitrite reductase/ring-hydroxylating ferredoxin subunit
MRSKASIKGHPIHPALIPFPFAFLYGALIFDLLGVLTDRPSWWATGGHLAVAGIAAAVVAAVPGLVDYLMTVPPHSTAKSRATKHMIVNLTAVALVGLALVLRPEASLAPGAPVLGLEVVAVGLLTVGGWMGGTLVNRNQIGVDHRYAQAGKWSEERIAGAGEVEVVVARSDELEVDQMKLLHLDGKRVVLARTEAGWVAFQDACTHRGGSLAGGVMICGTVQCPWHGSQFDARTGAVKAGPAKQPIEAFTVNERDGQIRLSLKRAPTGGKT